MYDGFVNAVKEVFGKRVKVVIDRFHVAKLYRNSFDDLRKVELRRLKKELHNEDYKRLKNIMWIMRKNPVDLADEELEALKLAFKHSPLLEIGYLLRNDLTDIFNANLNKTTARREIKLWINKVNKSGLECFKKFISTLEKMMDEILNYFIHRHSSGFVEGLNNKIKVIKRRCYGLVNPSNLFRRLHLDLLGYRNYIN